MAKSKLPDFIAFITIIPNRNPNKSSQTSSTISLLPDVSLLPSETDHPSLTLFTPFSLVYIIYSSPNTNAEGNRKALRETPHDKVEGGGVTLLPSDQGVSRGI